MSAYTNFDQTSGAAAAGTEKVELIQIAVRPSDVRGKRCILEITQIIMCVSAGL